MIDAVKLHRPAARRRAGLFLAEGPNLVEAALRSGSVERVFATGAAMERFADLLAEAPVRRVTERAAKALSDTVTPVGLVAQCRTIVSTWSQVAARSPRFVVVAVDISEPGNAGTLIRVADAMGADAVVLAGNSVDPFNGKSLRASAGSIFNIPVVPEGDVGAIAADLAQTGAALLATTLDGDLSLDEADAVLAGPAPGSSETRPMGSTGRRQPWPRIGSTSRCVGELRASTWPALPPFVCTPRRGCIAVNSLQYYPTKP
ncbi:RNA 2'-O ribose methyltransferase substrate binding family protein [Mycobacteroides abscessus subsp. bolletii 1513]|uniref:RNA 2'-O ribose methyltransferase substrate binding family protein n=1 Tax=Mycobacteroides abscessus subsp. bolletii 1513 TaxID=1299321 RepID=X8DRI2_9MYCO|nr:RNA 2'-O ribose methyltransferase substrate binding family protein [Mycobacteroides abscessus subsp. bolletii 1513]